jgi:signal transduction histidine kinase
MRSGPTQPPRRALAYVAAGLLLGLGYALLNTQTDAWANAGAIGRAFGAFHAFVDRGIPLLAGGLLGLAFHWLHLRGRLARAESMRADELRSRLRHVERDQAVWVVVASALHELKNPLHALGLLVDELEDVARSGDAAAVADHVVRVRALMDRTLVPLEALRALTRQGPRTRRTRPIGPTVADVVATLRPVAADAHVALRLEGDLDAATPVDPEYVRIILDNLVANALEAREDGAHAREVVIRLVDDAATGRVIVRVCDDGPGFPASGRSAMFEPLHGSKSSGLGLGLGLPIARALARTLGGELDAAEVPGFATSFELVVPATAGAR